MVLLLYVMLTLYIHYFDETSKSKWVETKVTMISVPCFQLPSHACIWDVCSGDYHTVLLADGATFCSETYYAGRLPNRYCGCAYFDAKSC